MELMFLFIRPIKLNGKLNRVKIWFVVGAMTTQPTSKLSFEHKLLSYFFMI